MSYKPHQKFLTRDDIPSLARKLNRMQTELSRSIGSGKTTIIRSSGSSSAGGGGSTGTSLHVEAGVTTCMVAGTAVTFATAYPTAIDAVHGDYVVGYRAEDSLGVPTTCRFTKSPTGMTIVPPFDGTVVEWWTIPRTA